MIRCYKPANNTSYKNILKNLKNSDRYLYFVKIETTGLNPNVDEICAIRVAKCSVSDKIQIVGSYKQIVQTEIPITKEASKVSGITQNMINQGVSIIQMLNELNRFLVKGSYICGFNTDKFLYPFLLGAYKRNHMQLNAVGGFDVLDLAKSVLLPDVNGAGYDIKTLCSLFKTECNTNGFVTVLNELYKRVSLSTQPVPERFVLDSKCEEHNRKRYIHFVTTNGSIYLNCNTLYFEDHANVFDTIDMDSFISYVLTKTKTKNLFELVQKLRNVA